MKHLNKKILDILEANDISVLSIEKQGKNHVSELEWFSPAGEDVIIVVWFNGTNHGFVDGFTKYAADFDPDDHAEMWVNSRGQNGVPSSIRELIEDADAIGAKLKEVSGYLAALKL